MTATTDFPTAYMRLRTLLDALEVNTLRYCMDGADGNECISRMITVQADLMNVIERVGGEAPCPDGYFNCGGVCVVYACVEGFAQKAEESMQQGPE